MAHWDAVQILVRRTMLCPEGRIDMSPFDIHVTGANSMQTAKVVSPLPLAFELAPLRGMSNGFMSIRRSSSQAAKMGDRVRKGEDVLDSFIGLGPTWIMHLSSYQTLNTTNSY